MLEVRPIVCTPDGVVLGGNMRLRACKEAGLREVPVHVVSWLDSQQEEFIIKDNVGYGEWDWDILANEWDANQLQDWGLDVWTPEAEPEEGLTDPDEVPNVPEEPKTKPGDMYILGKHRLLCGDSTNAEHVARLMDGQKATFIHADPPYGMGKEKDGVLNDNLYSDKLDSFQMAWWKAVRPHTADNGSAYIWGNAEDLWRLWYVGGLKDSERLTFRNEIVWDKKHGQGIGSEQHRMFPTVTEHCLFFMLGEQGFNNNADNYWEGWEPIRTYLQQERDRMGWDNKNIATWFGLSPTMIGQHWFSQSQWGFLKREQYERLQSEANGAAFKREYDDLKREHDDLKREHDRIKEEWYKTRAFFDNTHDNMTDVWDFPRVTGEERYGHATPKPVKMMERVMKSSASIGAVTIEPFLGSGSTLIAAEKTGRTCYGMELDPKYCDVIVKRWEDFTGKKAELVS
jgi:DNA modification methylase